jgi:hypothetical protein
VTRTFAEQADPGYEIERGFPTGATIERARYASDLRRTVEAYKFFYPTMGTEAVMQQMLAAGARENEAGIVMATSPLQQFGGANADTPYAITTVNLESSGPMVVELPPGPFIGFVNDHNMRWVQDVGTIGPDKGQGGRHLILPPGFHGHIPSGYFTGQSKTWKVVVFIRIMPIGGDVPRAIAAADGIKVYPLSSAGQPIAHHFIDVSAKVMPLPILAWEDKLEYWRQLHGVVQVETVIAEFRPMLGMLAQVGIEKNRPFDPDVRTREILERAASAAISEMRVDAYAKRVDGIIAWPGRTWEWFALQIINPETGDFGAPGYLSLEASDAYYFLGYGVSAAIGKPAVGAGSVYWIAYRDGRGEFLDGSKTYKLTVPGPVPAQLFWSATVYDADTRCQIATDQNRAAVRSLVDRPQANADASFDIHFGPQAPAGKDAIWIKTIPGKGWWSAFRIYGPKGPAFDGTWRLNDIIQVQ